jgi:nucleotide-binding universal stress UspA family protein
MKILIAYDGSECSEAALNDLKKAGLPPKADVLILSVADAWLPIGPDFMTTGSPGEYVAKSAEEALEFAQKASERIKKEFSGWNLQTDIVVGPPASVIIQEAEKWGADLIVMGSHGRSFLGRLQWGSVSQGVVTHAHCSVRIARAGGKINGKAMRLIIGTDGSSHSSAVIKRVVSGSWPKGIEIKVIAVIDPDSQEAYKWFEKTVKSAEERLCKEGFLASGTVMGGNPKEVLIQEAEKWHADCIFVGAKGLSLIERILLGGVSTAVAMRAHCSVEIVRS